MPSTYVNIATTTLGASAASVTFSSIPSTYTDLVIRYSARRDLNSAAITFTINSDTGTNYSATLLSGDGATATSSRVSNIYTPLIYGAGVEQSGYTASTFNNGEIYIPSYTSSATKPFSFFGVQENNATTSNITAHALLWRGTSAITSIVLSVTGSNFVANSSFYLYGIKNS